MICINLKSLMEFKLQVGSGSNHFKMSRGSFNYKQKISGKLKMERVSVEKMGDRTVTVFKSKKSEAAIRAELTTIENGITKLEIHGDTDRYNRYWLKFRTDGEEHIYGCGETYSKFDLKGEKVRIFVAEHQNANRIGKKIIKEKLFGKHPDKTLPFGEYESYYAQPTFVSSEKYFFHADVNAYSEFDFRNKDSISLYAQEPPVIYFYAADSFESLSKKCRSFWAIKEPCQTGCTTGQFWRFRRALSALMKR